MTSMPSDSVAEAKESTQPVNLKQTESTPSKEIPPVQSSPTKINQLKPWKDPESRRNLKKFMAEVEKLGSSTARDPNVDLKFDDALELFTKRRQTLEEYKKDSWKYMARGRLKR
jgi:hypothetical protein